MEQSVAVPAAVQARRERFAEAVLAFLAEDYPVLTYPEFPSPETGAPEVHAVQQMLVPQGQLDVLCATFPCTRSREVLAERVVQAAQRAVKQVIVRSRRNDCWIVLIP